jgi:hypothetical protein
MKIAKINEKEWSFKQQCNFRAEMWRAEFASLRLALLRVKGEQALAEAQKFNLRRHQKKYFLPGLKKLGITGESDAIKAAKYHYLSNILGGIDMEYIEENPKKVWIRYRGDMFLYGDGVFALPPSVTRATFAGWHPFNGLSLNNSKLGFVCTKVVEDGEPYYEGYFKEYEYDLDSSERMTYKFVSDSPDFEPDNAPKLDPNLWTNDRIYRTKRSFMRQYIESFIKTLLDLYGVPGACEVVSSAYLAVPTVYFTKWIQELGISGNNAQSLVSFFEISEEFDEDEVEIITESPTRYLMRKSSNKLFRYMKIPTSIIRAIFEYKIMCAKILNPRIKVKLTKLLSEGDSYDEWIVEDVLNRLF